MIRYNDRERRLQLGVGDLVAVGPARGDFRTRLAWTAARRMAAGREVHQRHQGAQQALDQGYRAEVVLRHRRLMHGWEVEMEGRLDGLAQEGDHAVVEEVKSSTLDREGLDRLVLEDLPAYERQVQAYLALLAWEGRPAVGRLVLVSLRDGAERLLHVAPDPDFDAWFEAQLCWLIERREAWIRWMGERRSAVVPFPHGTPRPGQERVVADLEASLAAGRQVLLVAPTGLGKTAAALTAALRVAMATDRRVFFATSRTTQQELVVETASALADRGLRLRVVVLRAREKGCLNGVVDCRADRCRFAERYHDKVLDAAWPESTWPAVWDGEALERRGRELGACPVELGRDALATADLVVGDHNHVFDPGARLEALSSEPEGWIVVVDEAHTLPERALAMGTVEVPAALVHEALEATAGPGLEAFHDAAAEVGRGLAELVESDEEVARPHEELPWEQVRGWAQQMEALALDHLAARGATTADGRPDPWVELARRVGRLRSALERADEATVALVSPQGLRLFCRDTAQLLGPTAAELPALLAMSATLEPADLYGAMLGFDPARVSVHRHDSPFPPEHKQVWIAASVSTAYRDRERDRAATAALVSEALGAIPGNVAVFFPSFAMRDALLPLIDTGPRERLVQPPQLSEAARGAWIARLREGRGDVLLAVMGGIFGEGVDLPGEGLRGVVVVGPALPPVELTRQLLQEWHEARAGEGFRRAYLLPGMARVVQAAGRVVRSPEDRGVVVLIDRRFLLKDHQAFFPRDWTPERSRDLGAELRAFFAVDGPAAPGSRDEARPG